MLTVSGKWPSKSFGIKILSIFLKGFKRLNPSNSYLIEEIWQEKLSLKIIDYSFFFSSNQIAFSFEGKT